MKSSCLIPIAFLAVCALEVGHTQTDDDDYSFGKSAKIKDFKSFRIAFNKHYRSVLEEMARQQLFLARFIRSRNSWMGYKSGMRDSYLGINQMSDWTEEERGIVKTKTKLRGNCNNSTADQNVDKTSRSSLRKGCTLGPEGENFKTIAGSSRGSSSRGTDIRSGSSDAIIDLRTTNCFYRPMDQGDCNSCYAFSAIAMYEYLYCRTTGSRVKFSEQYVIDCGRPFGLRGCDWGSVEGIAEFAEYMGFENGSEYVYLGYEGGCPYSASNGGPMDYSKVGFVKAADSELIVINIDKFSFHLERMHPIYATMRVNREFEDYGGGIDSGQGCEHGYSHAVLIIGEGVEDGRAYWLIRNTYGPDWGESGYYRLNKNARCFAGNGGCTLKAFIRLRQDYFRSNPHHSLVVL